MPSYRSRRKESRRSTTGYPEYRQTGLLHFCVGKNHVPLIKKDLRNHLGTRD